ncbi:MAG: hypothetical protein JST92_08610, partial [Deltaproteobacteria bacterium]|nr:hypothetical protein [Deltaproteobacteria bacterium]
MAEAHEPQGIAPKLHTPNPLAPAGAMNTDTALELPDPRGVHAQPPDSLVPFTPHTPPTIAGGIPAVISSMKHALGEAGVIRGTRLLLALNQANGFDCPGCAWPDPDH